MVKNLSRISWTSELNVKTETKILTIRRRTWVGKAEQHAGLGEGP